jgi:transposase-like protein
MEKCKYCGMESLRPDGVRNGNKKWRCRKCNRSQGLIDHRLKYTEKEREMAEVLYLEGCGFRRTSRVLSSMFGKYFRWQTVVKWIRKAAIEIEKQGLFCEPKDEKIEILETIKSEYGLLLIGTGSYLVHFK